MKPRDTRSFVGKMYGSLFDGTFVKRFLRHLWRIRALRYPVESVMRLFMPVRRDTVVFATFSGTFGCNPRYIAEELVRRRTGLKVKWLSGEASLASWKGPKPEGIEFIPVWSARSFVTALTACAWIENAQMFLLNGMPRKRRGQYYLDTWHGSLGIKRLGSASEKTRERAEKASRAVDAVLTNSTFEDTVLADSVLRGVPMLRYGHPRNDIFFRSQPELKAVRARVFETIGLPPDRRLALYAPTFRAEGFFAAAGRLDFASWAAALSERFGGEWTVAVRLHPHDAKAMAEGLYALPSGLTDVSSYGDIQELLVAADAGITDYSSWIFDYLLSGKPGFIFAPDKSEYDRTRGFYYPLEETPFPVATDEVGLNANIRSFDEAAYAGRMREFLAARGCMEDGQAAVRAVDLLLEKIGIAANGAER